jgi:rubrerythrin
MNNAIDPAPGDLAIAEGASTDPGLTLVADLVWRCQSCGYQREAPAPPGACPQCGAEAGSFEGRSRVGWRLRFARRQGA